MRPRKIQAEHLAKLEEHARAIFETLGMDLSSPPLRTARSASHLRAQMGGGEIDGHAVRLEQANQKLGDLLFYALLHRQSALRSPD